MRKLTVTILALCMILTLASCSGAPAESSTSPAQSDSNIKVEPISEYTALVYGVSAGVGIDNSTPRYTGKRFKERDRQEDGE